MSDLRDLLDNEAYRVRANKEALSWVMHRVQRKRRTRRAATGAVALMIAAVGAFGAYRAFSPRPDDRRLGQTTPQEVFEGIWPETGPQELHAAQRSIDEGHQPWRTDPVETARAFATNVMQWQYEQVDAQILGWDDPTAVLVQLYDRDSPNVDADLSTLVTLKQLGRRGAEGIWSVVSADGGLIRTTYPGPEIALESGAPLNITGELSYGAEGISVEMGLFAGEGGIPFDSEGSLAVRRFDVSDHTFAGELGTVPEDPDGSVILMSFARDPTGNIIGVAATRLTIGTPENARRVLVFFSFDSTDPSDVQAVPRLVPDTADPLESALRELLRGPTGGEQAKGLASVFGSHTMGSLNFATVENGVAIVDFANFWLRVAKASAVDGHVGLESQLNATVFQFPHIKAVVYQFDGTCQAFPHLAEVTPCTKIARPNSSDSLPPDVAAKRDAIMEAARDRKFEALHRLTDPGNFTFSYGGGQDPIAYWKDLETQGEDPLLILQELLTMPHIYLEDGDIYVWPSLFDKNPSTFTEDQLRLAERIATKEEIQSWKEYGSYLGYRVGIEADGDWIFFVAGD